MKLSEYPQQSILPDVEDCPPAPAVKEEEIWSARDLRLAFVLGAKWWEFEQNGATMWRTDQEKAANEAERQYPDGEPGAMILHMIEAISRK